MKTPLYAGAAALIVVVAGVFAVGGSQPVDPEARGRLFAAPPRRDGEGRSPLSSLRRTIQEGFDEFTPASEDPFEPTDEPDDDAPATDEPVETEPAAVPTEEPAATDVPAATAEPSAAPASGTPAGSPAPEATSAPVG